MQKTKIGLIGLLVLAALYIAASWFVGMRLQTLAQRAADQGNARLEQTFGTKSAQVGSLTIADYQRGVFTSRVRYELNLPAGAAGTAPQTVQVQIELAHGPFPWKLVRNGDFSPLLAYADLQLLPTPLTQTWFDAAGEHALQGQARVHFAQDGSLTVTVAPVDMQRGDDTLHFSGGQINFTFTQHFAEARGAGSFAGFDITESGQQVMRIRDISLTSQSLQRNEIVQSESRLNAASAHILLPGVGDLAIENFGIDFAAEQAGTLMDSSIGYHLGRMQWNERDFGSFDLGVRARRLDVLALTALSQDIERLALDEDDGDSLDALQTHLRTLLQSEPSFAIDPLRWRTDKGESTATLTADFFLPDDNAAILEDLGLQSLREATLAIDVSRTMALHVAGLGAGGANPVTQGVFAMLFDQYASRLEAKGLVRVDGDKVSLRASYRGEDESVELNGKRMSLGEFVVDLLRAF